MPKPGPLTLFSTMCAMLALFGLTVAGCAATPSEATVEGRPVVGKAAPDFKLPDVTGKQHRLSTYTDAGPVVLLVLRGYPGYQCPICSRQVGDYIRNADEFTNRDAHVVMVYPGPAEGLGEHAKEFVAGKSLPNNFVLLTDPGFEFTNLYGVRWEKGNETAYPSTFVIDKGVRTVRHAHVSNGYRDRPTAQQILAVMDGQAVSADKRKKLERPKRYWYGR